MPDSRRERWDQRYAQAPMVWSREPCALLVETLARQGVGASGSARALDTGAGEGRNAIWLAAAGWQTTAIDFSSVGINKGRAIADKVNAAKVLADDKKLLQIDWRCQALEDFRPSPESFELIIWVYVHLPEHIRLATWQQILPSLKIGGHFVYIGHDPSNIGRGAGGPQTTDVLPSIAQLRQTLTDYSILDARTVEREVSADSGHGNSSDTNSAIDTLLHAVRRS